jgi:hypothetical protein
MKLIVCLLAAALSAHAAPWKNLFNGRNLDGWEPRGNCQWSVMKDGTLLGERPHPGGADPFGQWPINRQQYGRWLNQQAWIYSNAEYEEFDLRLEYLIPHGGNSGVSIRDTSRARYGFLPEWDPSRTPSHVGYEIQIIDNDKEKFPTGSIYLFAPAKTGLHRPGEWNTLEIESRRELIRVRVNGQVVAEGKGDPARAKKGPIGLQLHDRFSWAMFRNVRLREVKGK